MRRGLILGLFLLSFILVGSFGVVSGEESIPSCTDSDDGINYYVKGITTGPARCVNQSECMDSLSVTDACDSDNTGIEFYCENGYRTAAPDFKCSNGCSDGACIGGTAEAVSSSASTTSSEATSSGSITEKITCVFKNSETKQQCYLAGTFGNSDEGKKFCYGDKSCSIYYTSYSGESVTWKSSCGEYQYTKQDGESETITFDCLLGQNSAETGNVNFKFAYWQCYDGTEEKQGDETSCKPTELWKSYAEEFCKDKCSEETGKCGVNSFSVSGECSETAGTVTEIRENGNDMEDKIGFTFVEWTCPDGSTNKYGEESGPCLSGNFWEEYIANSCKEPCDEEGGSCSRDPISAITSGECVVGESTSEESKPTVCKDSCPFENSCLPIGYRQNGEYCSGEGAFKMQFGSSEQCDNNFECGSNVCVSGQCVETGLIQKILEWFRKLFGGEIS